MIKNVKKFLKGSETDHKKFLRRLTGRKNIRILESMLSSKIYSCMHFNNDDNPIALYKLMAKTK